MKILGIETSCDETAASVLEIYPVKSSTTGRGVSDKKQFDGVKNGKFNLLSNVISSQEKIHAKYGGIVPEVAARMQMEMILPVIQEALIDAEITPPSSTSLRTPPLRKGRGLKEIDYIAVTQGPGLITSLTVGIETAKTLAYTLNKPLIPVNHLAGHLLVNHLNSNEEKTGFRIKSGTTKGIKYPAIGLLVSGGHTMLILIKNESNYKMIGQTVDDAAGEAFDKVAKILGLGYPGGPVISKTAIDGDPTAFKLPRPMISQNNLDFSFSGLKTAVLYAHRNHKSKKTQKSRKYIKDMCASFQQAVVDVLISKTLRTIKQYSSSSADKRPKSFLLGGGVAANPELRNQLKEKINSKYPEIQIFIPELEFTGDNAPMIAVAAYFKITKTKKQTSKKHQKSNTKHQINNIKADPNLIL